MAFINENLLSDGSLSHDLFCQLQQNGTFCSKIIHLNKRQKSLLFVIHNSLLYFIISTNTVRIALQQYFQTMGLHVRIYSDADAVLQAAVKQIQQNYSISYMQSPPYT